MIWKRYQNELIVAVAFVSMLGAYLYKHNQVTVQARQAQEVRQSLEELKEVISLQKIWADKKTGKKVSDIQKLVPAAKVKWGNKGKKVTASYTGLSPNELNRLVTKILNLPVVITLLDIQKNASDYTMEFKCKW